MVSNQFYRIPFPNIKRKIDRFCIMTLHLEVLRESVVYKYGIAGYLSDTDSIYGSYQKFYTYGTPYKYDPVLNKSVFYWINGKRKIFQENLTEKMRRLRAKMESQFEVQPRVGQNVHNVVFEVHFWDKMPSHKYSLSFFLQFTRWITWVNFHFVKTNVSPDEIDHIVLNSFSLPVKRIHGDKILKLSMNQERYCRKSNRTSSDD